MPTLADNVECLNCGYNLRGIDPGGVCPECGAGVATSLRLDRLGEVPPAFRRRLVWGAGLLHWGVLLSIAGLPVGAVLAGVRLVWVAHSARLTAVGAVLVVLGLYAGVAVAGVGWLMLTGKQPGRDEPRADRVRRVVTRILVTVGLVMLVPVLATAAYMSMDLRSWASWSGLEYVDSSLIALHALLAIAMLSGWSHVHSLASRIPDPGLMRRCRLSQGLWVGGLVLAAVPLMAASVGFYLGLEVTLEMEQAWAVGTIWLLVAAAVWLWGVAVWSTAGIWREMRAVGDAVGDVVGVVSCGDDRADTGVAAAGEGGPGGGADRGGLRGISHPISGEQGRGQGSDDGAEGRPA